MRHNLLLRYPQASGGIDNVATALSDLGQKSDTERLAALSKAVDRPVVQRLGHLLDRLGHAVLTGPMLEALQARGSAPWTELDRQEAGEPDFASEARERNSRWRIIVRRVPEDALTEESTAESYRRVFTSFVERLPGESWGRTLAMKARFGIAW